MLRTEEKTLNLMEDIWSSLHLSPEVIVAPTASGDTNGIYIVLTDDLDPEMIYWLDNGHDSLPDGLGLRARYKSVDGPVIFAVKFSAENPAVWQQRAVEPLIVALRTHMADLRAAEADNVWEEREENKA